VERIRFATTESAVSTTVVVTNVERGRRARRPMVRAISTPMAVNKRVS